MRTIELSVDIILALQSCPPTTMKGELGGIFMVKMNIFVTSLLADEVKPFTNTNRGLHTKVLEAKIVTLRSS